MYRSMMQLYVRGADEAIALYQRAFDAKLLEIHRTPDGQVVHSELDVHGQIVAVSDREPGEDTITGNTMQLCLHFGKGLEANVVQAYEALREGGTVRTPLSPCEWSTHATDVIDRFGVRWCIFV